MDMKSAKSKRVNIYINELVIEGFPTGDKHKMAESLQKELRELFQERGLPQVIQTSKKLDSIKVDSFPISPNTSMSKIGQRSAKTIYRGLMK
jgi:hypothetical protein